MAQNVLIWLPSPLGDAVMATPALRSLRGVYKNARLVFLAAPTVKAFLEPLPFCDSWMELKGGYLNLVGRLRQNRFAEAALLKNSFGSALAVFLAGIPRRIGYSRDGRSILLTDKIRPPKDANGDFVPHSALDYYLGIAGQLCGQTGDRSLYIGPCESGGAELAETLPQLKHIADPLVVLVPGGAFGPSKLWPVQRFAVLADRLVERYNATIVISVAPTETEKAIASDIRSAAAHDMISLSDTPLSPAALKALFAKASLVIANDTGPRHIAAALGKNLITLFGPNNPAWTHTGYPNEIQIIGEAPCLPCDRPICRRSRHLCMESISVERVLAAAQRFLKDFDR